MRKVIVEVSTSVDGFVAPAEGTPADGLEGGCR